MNIHYQTKTAFEKKMMLALAATGRDIEKIAASYEAELEKIAFMQPLLAGATRMAGKVMGRGAQLAGQAQKALRPGSGALNLGGAGGAPAEGMLSGAAGWAKKTLAGGAGKAMTTAKGIRTGVTQPTTRAVASAPATGIMAQLPASVQSAAASANQMGGKAVTAVGDAATGAKNWYGAQSGMTQAGLLGAAGLGVAGTAGAAGLGAGALGGTVLGRVTA